MDFQDYFELNQLYARYAAVVSAGDWDQWPEFFTDDCVYRIQPRENHERGFPLARYQVTLPVQGSYGEVRGFVDAVLDAVPAAALEELALKREEIGEPLVEARVRFVLFLGAE